MDTQILFSKKHNLIIGCHARCWSKSMIVWFGRMNGYVWDKDNKWFFHKNAENNSEFSLWTYDDSYIKNNFKNFKTYFFVRNPYERFYSHLLAHRQYQKLSFSEAVKKAILPNGLKPELLYNKASQKILNNLNYQIIDFPNIKNTLLDVKKELCIDIDFEYNDYKKEYHYVKKYENKDNLWDLTIEKINTIPCGCFIPDYKLMYNQELKNIVYNFYKKDFEFFNLWYSP